MKMFIRTVALICMSTVMANAQNLVSSQSWTIGTGSIGMFNTNGTASENIREMGTGPHGDQVILWKATPDGNAQADGGWDSQSFTIDNTKMYRFAVWIKKTNSTDGTTYFGCSANDILNLSGTVNTNPYFWSGDLAALDKWYLLVGYVHASSDPSTSNYGGIYDGETGAKLISIIDYKFSSGATAAAHRTYLYYDPNTTDRQYFYGPEVYQIGSNQPLNEFNSATAFNGNAYFGERVGIGTTTPRGTFDVDGPGDIVLSDDPIGGSTQGIYLPGHVYLGPYTGGDVSYLQARRSDNSGTTALRLRTYNNGSLTEAMHIAGNGNVGIGTTTPSEKLTVSGTVYAKEVKVDLSVPGPDYVFKKDYDLPSLDEVKAHLEKFNRLPEVPSADEMAAKGLQLGEMNMLLLKKIEELTIYVIQLENENQRQDSLIQHLQIKSR